MFKKIFTTRTLAFHPCHMLAKRHSTGKSAAVDSVLLRSIKEHYLEVSKMTPPPKINPPDGFSVMKGALESDGPVLRKIRDDDEEITVMVMRLADLIPEAAELDSDDDSDQSNQLFLHVDVSKPGQKDSLHFLIGLYPDAMGIHSVSLRPKLQTPQFLANPAKYGGPTFHNLKERTKDALHRYIEERGVNEELFPFLQAWLYVKEHRNLMRWFKTVGNFISEQKPGGDGK